MNMLIFSYIRNCCIYSIISLEQRWIQNRNNREFHELIESISEFQSFPFDEIEQLRGKRI